MMLKFEGKPWSPAGRRAAAGAMIALAAALGASCGSGGGGTTTEAPTVPATAVLVTQALYQVVFVNALDNTVVTDPLTVSFAGTPKILDTQGNVLNGKSVTTTTGEVSLGAEFTAGANEFTVQVGNRALGWSESGTRIVGSADLAQTQTIVVKLLNVKAAAQITADLTKAISSASTTVAGFAAPITVASTPKAVTTADGTAVQMGVASVAIPAGINAVDSTGARQTVTGAITVTTTAYSSQDVSALTAFPGGFAATISAAPGVAASNTETFITGGFAQFNMTDSTGKALKQFDQPLTLSIDLPKSTLDQAGAPVRAGTTFPVWSYDDATGAWKFERDGLIQEKTPVDPNNFRVEFQSNHLSSWNLDYRGQTCTGRINLNRGTDTRPLRVTVTGIPGRPYAYEVNNIKDGFIDVRRAPTTPLNVRVFDGTSQVGQLLDTSICAPVTVALNLPVVNQGGLIVNVTESCVTGSNPRAYPTFVTVSRPGVLPIGRYTTVTGGVASSTFTNVLSGAVTVSLFNKYTNTTLTQAATIPVGSSATVNANLPNVPCAVTTGAG